MIKHLLLSALLFFSLFSNESESKIDLLKLSQDPTWLRLLYFNKYTNQSDVTSNEYFLSKEGKHNPLAELNATIEAYSQTFQQDSNEHAMCRFPARYMWLSKHIELPDYKIVNPRCEKLSASLEVTHIDSVSLMFVSGYLGNPASSFGHSFIKLNNYTNSSQTNLFDLAISYGANVPKNENIFLYMYNGLSGGYEASITDKYFYTQDLVYGNTEFRDIWEYEMNLSKEKILFFQLHLWEILGKNFQYYFLNRNCGYEISKMLEVVSEEDLVENARFWFSPIETFHKLSDINTKRQIIKHIIFHPSEQKKIYKIFNQLTQEEKLTAKALFDSEFDTTINSYADLTHKQKTEIINFMLSYYNYLLIKEKNSQKYKELKKKALMERFILPVKRGFEPSFPKETPPNEDDRPFMFFTNFNIAKNSTQYLSFGFAPYAVQSLGQNNLNGNELIVLKTEIAAIEGKAFIKEFDLIKIKSLDRYQTELNEGTKVSWQVNASVQNTNIPANDYDAYLSGGVGKSWYPSESFFGYIMMNASLHSQKDCIQLSPELGLQLDFDKLKLRSTFKDNYDILHREFFLEKEVESNIKISKNISLYLKYHSYQESFTEFTTGIQMFF